MNKPKRFAVTFAIAAAVIAAGVWIYQKCKASDIDVSYQTAEVLRQDIASSVSATGTLEPEELVNAGAQVSGKIVTFGKDSNGSTIDYGSPVTEGMVLANIDDSVYDAEMRSAQAQKQQAEAEILSSKAEIRLAEAKLELAQSNWTRASELYPKKAMAKSEYDNAQAELLAAKATRLVRIAALKQANARLASAEAAYDKAARNLSYCVITSPVDGVIIDRRVSVGQTVVSNMSASSIFLIAKDLKRMQVWVSVNEADIGSIRAGMPVEFTVDAFPGETFYGTVHKIRLNATMSQNVVTYVVEAATDNADGRLLPYLTASVKFIKESRKQALVVPNAALRFRPDPAQLAGEYSYPAAAGRQPENKRTVWVLQDGKPRPVSIVTGLNDGIVTEVVSGELTQGMHVITGAVTGTAVKTAPGAEKSSSGSPFLPKPPQRKR